jgi:membrane protease YdiL (CAAX protease family)
MKNSLLLALELILVLIGIALIATGIFPLAIILLFFLAWLSLNLRRMGWRDVGLRRPASILGTIALGVIIGIGFQFIDSLFIGPFLQQLTGEAVNLSAFSDLKGNLPMLIASLLLTWTEAAFIEEMFFRAYLLNRLTDLFGRAPLGIALALIVHAALFGLGHTYQDLTGVLDTFVAGLVLGVIYLLNRRNLWLNIIAHGVIDTTAFVLLYLGLASS